jgi:hypothetical protein
VPLSKSRSLPPQAEQFAASEARFQRQEPQRLVRVLGGRKGGGAPPPVMAATSEPSPGCANFSRTNVQFRTSGEKVSHFCALELSLRVEGGCERTWSLALWVSTASLLAGPPEPAARPSRQPQRGRTASPSLGPLFGLGARLTPRGSDVELVQRQLKTDCVKPEEPWTEVPDARVLGVRSSRGLAGLSASDGSWAVRRLSLSLARLTPESARR